MVTVGDVRDFISRLAPQELAEEWDNTGLLVGDPAARVAKIMTCLTVTSESLREAIETGCELIVPHHPLPFRPFKRLVATDYYGGLLLQLIGSRMAVISAHTAFDSTSGGINELLATRFGVSRCLALVPSDPGNPASGAGRYGELEQPIRFRDILDTARKEFSLSSLQYVGDPDSNMRRLGFACGSGGSLIESAIACRCNLLVTGEASFHSCLEARAAGLGLLLLGHFASERFAMEILAEKIQGAFPDCEVWCSAREQDPVHSLF